jgi:hypothetical protein
VIDFRLKGSRAYVQGPDMVEAAMREVMAGEAAGQVSNLDFVMNRMTGRNLDLIVDEVEPAGAAAVARFSFEAGGAARRGILVERSDKPAGSHAYDEDELRRQCQVDAAGRRIVLQGASPFTPVETLVAMTKALHLAVYPQKAGQWLFARLEAPRWPLGDLGEGLEVRLGHGVGTRLTKSSARLGGEPLAWIFFSFKERA